jgi:uncharacterized repeat protein (TIGR01451 family)
LQGPIGRPSRSVSRWAAALVILASGLAGISALGLASKATAASGASISVSEAANPANFSTTGQNIIFVFYVTNSGSTPLTSVAVTDPLPGLPAVTCPKTTLGPSESETCSATVPTAQPGIVTAYTTTSGDVSAALITSAATVTAVPPSGPAVSASSTTTVPLVAAGAFSCPHEIDFLSQGLPDTGLFLGTYGPGTINNATQGPAVPLSYNAIGYNPVDHLMYAMAFDYGAALGTPGTLYKINNVGTVTSLGVVTGYTPSNIAPADGAFDSSGNYWITDGNGSTKAYEINVNASPPTVINTLTLSAPWAPIDFASDGGYLWGLSGATLYRLDPTSGTVSSFAAPSGLVGGNFGAAWTFTNGNLGFSNNATGDVYELGVGSAATPSITLIGHYLGPIAGASNDGAACTATVQADLGIVKTGPSVVPPSSTVSWTLTVTNNGPGSSSGFSVDDMVPSNITNVASSTPGCAVIPAGSNNVVCSEGLAGPGTVFTATITGTSPSTVGTCLTNTATVTGNEVDPNPSNNSSSLQTCVAGIGLVKSASISHYSAAGTQVTYYYKVTNAGTVTLNSVTVTDPMPGLSAISCPSSTLAAGASEICTASYTTTVADVSAGSISNTGTAVGFPVGSLSEVTAQSSLTIPDAASSADLPTAGPTPVEHVDVKVTG